jgi:hypothetical protein
MKVAPSGVRLSENDATLSPISAAGWASDGREITYRSVAEMTAAVAFLQNRMADAAFQRTTYTSFARD